MTWKPDPQREPDAAFILERLDRVPTVYVAHPARIKAAMALRERGVVSCQWGSGRDQGFLLVQKATAARSWSPGGGSAA